MGRGQGPKTRPHKPRPVLPGHAPPRDPCGLRILPSGGPGSLQAARLPPVRSSATAWRGRSVRPRGRGRGRFRRRCREAEPPLFPSPEPGSTRDTRRRRSGTAPACCRPATSPRGDAQLWAVRAGRIRGGRGAGEPGGAGDGGQGVERQGPCSLMVSDLV